MLVQGVRSLADATHAIERGNSDAGGEVAVRTAADCCFVEFPVEFAGDRPCLLVKRCDSGIALHGQAVDATFDAERAMLVKRFQRAEAAVEAGGLLRSLDANIDFDRSFRRNHIGARTTADDSGIDRQTALQVVKLRHFDDLAREFENRAVSLAGFEACVRGDASDGESVIANALARGLDGTVPGCGFEYENGGRLAGQRFRNLTRRTTADFFIGNKEYCDWTRQRSKPCLQRLDRMPHQSNARLHVEHARAVEAAIGLAAGHGGESAERVHGVEMPEQEDGLGFFASGKIDLYVIAEVVGVVDAHAAAERFEFLREKDAHAIGGGLVVAGRLDFGKLADGAHEFFLLAFEIAQAIAPHIFGLTDRLLVFPGRHGWRSLRSGWLRNASGRQAVQYNLQAVWGEFNRAAARKNHMTEGTPVTETSLAETKTGLDIHEILKILPHRYPFLLIDRVLELKRKERIVAIKNVTINEPFFNGHFPGLPIMPGVLIVEAIAQAGGALLLTEVEDRSDKVMVFTGIERARFRRPVSPGDQLRITVELKGWREVPGMTAAKMFGVAQVGDKKVAEAMVSCQLIDAHRGRGAGSGEEDAE